MKKANQASERQDGVSQASDPCHPFEFLLCFFFQSIMRRNMAEKDKTASNGCMDYFAAAWIGFLTDGE